MSWTTPADIQRQVQNWWERGDILTSLLTQEPVFPKRLTLKTPTATELRDRFEEARTWAAALRNMPHVRLESREFRHRVLGQNSVPERACIPTCEDAIALLGKTRETAQFMSLATAMREYEPALIPWMTNNPLKALSLANDWLELIAVTHWIKAHPKPGIHLRQMAVPGVHTKFVERHRALLAQWLDIVLPESSMDAQATASQFAQRYGFRAKPEHVRLRMLDTRHNLLRGTNMQDLTVDATTFARLECGARHVFITENETNFLAFPEVEDGMILFGAGYGFAALSDAAWLKQCQLYYWGDIDTHGYAILDEWRSHFPHTRSFLMDSATLAQFAALWGKEPKPVNRDLMRLTSDEKALYDDLRDNRIRPNLRLEQEHIGFNWVLDALRRLPVNVIA